MKRFISIALGMMSILASCSRSVSLPDEITLSKAALEDKIRGAWAGQIIGCTYGGPTEFSNVFYMNDKIPIPWSEHYVKETYTKNPGLYDDIYMDLTFVDVFDRVGLDAPVDSFAMAFAKAEYPLWHANAQARYNILHGIMPPASGNWMNNPHADDIDFQIESDYAGIMTPGMVNATVRCCDGIGHMMNCGDGYYGGVYLASMYSLAFVSDDIDFIAREALKIIPEESRYRQAMEEVIRCHGEYPDDWHDTWLRINKDYNYEKGCPEGVQTGFDIDALLNSAYVLIGLLYGDGDFGKTIDIATRCGSDSDCNPASAGGILGTILGYDAIPEVWRKPMDEAADIDFKYTTISLDDAVRMSLSQAQEMIEREGGEVNEDNVVVKVQKPQAIPFEQCFEGIEPGPILFVRRVLDEVDSVCFDGVGVVVRYNFLKDSGFKDDGYAAEVEVSLDGKADRTVILPASGNGTSPEFYFRYDIPDGHHSLTFNWLNRKEGINLRLSRVLTYVKE